VITFSFRRPARRRAHALIYPLSPLSRPGREIDLRSFVRPLARPLADARSELWKLLKKREA